MLASLEGSLMSIDVTEMSLLRPLRPGEFLVVFGSLTLMIPLMPLRRAVPGPGVPLAIEPRLTLSKS